MDGLIQEPWPTTEADARAVPERLRRPTGFPYIPGLLSFHEAPAILSVWR